MFSKGGMWGGGDRCVKRLVAKRTTMMAVMINVKTFGDTMRHDELIHLAVKVAVIF